MCFTGNSLVDLSTAAHSNRSARPWVKFQSAGWVNIQSARTNDGKTPSCWSAVTLVVGKSVVVILNSSHSTGRQSSDLMHELSHRILGHETHDMDASPAGIMLLSGYDKKQEEEADWLSGCLLLPRQALVSIKSIYPDLADAAQVYGVSKQMLKYRLDMTGVNKQFA